MPSPAKSAGVRLRRWQHKTASTAPPRRTRRTRRTGPAKGTQGTQGSTFIAGIYGTAVEGVEVLVDGNGQLGIAPSSRSVKQDVDDLAPLADRLLELRPVSFRYRKHAAADPDGPLQFGLIAEEVAEVFPELVVYDDSGAPYTVRYHLLVPLLLAELQRQHAEIEELRRSMAGGAR